MLSVLPMTAPIFILIALGYVAVRLDLMPAEAVPGLGRFVLFFSMPALIFYTLSGLSLRHVIEPYYLMAYGGGSLLLLILGFLFTLLVLKNGGVLASFKSLGMVVPNSVLFGYPVLLQVFEDPPARAMAMSLVVESLFLLPMALALLEFNSNRTNGNTIGRVLLGLLGRVLRNPLVLAIIAGTLVSGLNITVPPFINTSLELLSRASAAVALFVIGGSLVGSSVRGNVTGMSTVMLGKLLAHPLLVALMVWWLPPFDPDLQWAAILIAAMPVMSVYPIIGSQYGQGSFAAGTLLLTTSVAFITLSALLLLR